MYVEFLQNLRNISETFLKHCNLVTIPMQIYLKFENALKHLDANYRRHCQNLLPSSSSMKNQELALMQPKTAAEKIIQRTLKMSPVVIALCARSADD